VLELVTGAIVAVAVVALVIEPLLSRRPRTRDLEAGEWDFVELEESGSPKVRALLALKEIEFDHATGKLSDEDYQSLKVRYAREALDAMEPEPVQTAVPESDPAEEAIARFRTSQSTPCPDCGDRPEAGAVFCSSCGRSLAVEGSAPRCWMCGANLVEGSRFCGECGHALVT
jgi:hypothetical protein